MHWIWTSYFCLFFLLTVYLFTIVTADQEEKKERRTHPVLMEAAADG
jgi:hypothetical protein